MIEAIDAFISTIEMYVKVITWPIVLIAAIILFSKQVICGIVLKTCFHKRGINFFQSFVVPFISRDKCVQLTRKFIEYIILHESDSDYISWHAWDKLILDFRAKYVESDDNVYELDSTFDLKKDNIENDVKEYFELIKKYNKIFVVDKDAANRFLLEVKINNGYLTPFIQISSLQERYKSDWSKVLEQYSQEFSISNYKIPSEVSSFYTWLMWGPSTSVIPDGNCYKMCLLGLGDESMSLPLVIPPDKDKEIWEDVKKGVENNNTGEFVSGTYIIYDKLPYLKSKKLDFDDETKLYITKIIDSKEDGFLIESTGDTDTVEHKNQTNIMFQAYIWAMFYYYNSEEEKTTFNCMNSTVLFEHANISDSENVNLLTKTLISKCKLYLKTVANDVNAKDRKYCIPWAINERIRKQLYDAIKNDPEISMMLEDTDAFITHESILTSIDDEFSDGSISAQIHNIDFSDEKDLGLFGRFYCELYMREFPNPDERESLENIIDQAKRMEKYAQCKYHCLVATLDDDRSIVGGVIGDYLADCNSGAIEFIVVDSRKRNLHIATRLLKELTKKFNEDARRYSVNQVYNVDYTFFEVDNPEMIDESEKEAGISRLHFWDKMHAYKLDFKYIQTSLEELKNPVECLMLAVIVSNAKIAKNTAIPKKTVLKFLECYFTYGFGKKDVVNSNVEYKKMEEELSSKENVDIKKLI